MDTEISVRLVLLSLDLVKAGGPPTETIHQVVQQAADEIPSPAWEAIGEVDLVGDIDATSAWLVHKLNSDPPNDLSGLWFGLYEAESPGHGHIEAVVSVSGGPEFPDPEWLFHQDWRPEGFAPTPGLRSIIPLAQTLDPDNQELVSYAIVFAYVAALASGVCDSEYRLRILGARPQLAIASGFHDGDILLLGVLRADGLDRTDLGWT